MCQQVEELYAKYGAGMSETAKTILQEGYYRNIYEIQKGYGAGSTFSTLDTETVKKVIAKPWAPDGSNFSEKIWKDRETLVGYLNREVPQAFIRGEGPDRLIKEIKKQFGVSAKNAARLVQTESAYFSAMAKLESYKASGFNKYIIVAVMDAKTSQICRDMDGEVFDIEDFKPGITANPFHPRCRSTTAPYAGNKEGRTAPGMLYDHDKKEMYTVPEGTTYKEWYREHAEKQTLAYIDEYGKIELSDDELWAINRYIGGENYVLNEKLRNSELLTDDESRWVKLLGSALAKTPNYEGVAIRHLTLRENVLNTFLEEYKVDKKVTSQAFMSFSKLDDYAEDSNVIIKIVSTKAKDISRINKDEQEIIYLIGSKFKVLGVKIIDNIYYITIEEA